jgi:glutaryl-CoA dehydrogenase
MITNFKDMGDHLLNGAKNVDFKCPFADIAVVWAKNEEGRIHGLIVERGMEGFTTPETHNKWSLRASSTGELIFDNVKVPKKICYQTNLVLAPLGCLDSARYGIAWGAIVLLWIVMTLHFVMLKSEFNLTNQSQERNYSKRN